MNPWCSISRKLTRGASVHTLRHTFGVHLIAQGVDLDLVRQIMGLNRLRQVDVYVRLARTERGAVVQADELLAKEARPAISPR